MEYKWLNKEGNNKIILFFNGWGMDECVVNHLEHDDYDIIMFYDYNTLETDFDFKTLDIYQEKYLIAWSMGVMTATLFDVDYDSKTAINGTLKPIDDKYGIPKKIYDLTVIGFSLKGAEKFIRNMFSENTVLNVQRDFESQKSELERLTHYCAKENFKYDKIFISTKDRIIPTKNQVAFWGIEPNLDSGHCPFFLFKKWSELL